jgi:protein TonB
VKRFLLLAVLSGVFISLVLFWLMQAMINPNQQPLKHTKSLQMTPFIKLKKLDKVMPKKREVLPKESLPPPPPSPAQKSIEQKATPEMEIPELALSQPDLLTHSEVKLKLAVIKKKPKTQLLKKPKRAKPKQKKQAQPQARPIRQSQKIVTVTPAPKTITTKVEPAKVVTKKLIKKVVKKPAKIAKPTLSNQVNSNVQATYKTTPKYPKRAQNRRQQGWVKIQFIITASGQVKSPFVVSSKPSHVFDKAALKAIRRWKFKAKRVNGQAVAQRAVQTIKFKLR